MPFQVFPPAAETALVMAQIQASWAALPCSLARPHARRRRKARRTAPANISIQPAVVQLRVGHWTFLRWAVADLRNIHLLNCLYTFTGEG